MKEKTEKIQQQQEEKTTELIIGRYIEKEKK